MLHVHTSPWFYVYTVSIAKSQVLVFDQILQMKVRIFLGLAWVFFQFIPNELNAQTIPQMHLQSIDGQEMSTEEVFNEGQPILLVFWATWCSHTLTGLTTIQDDYLIDWVEDYNIKVIAVSVDDMKTSNRAVTLANTNAWDFDVFLDVNGDFKRAMGVNNAPHVFLLDSQGEIIWQQNAFMEGDEDRIEEFLIEESK